jgi:DNA-binding GntR family transcriptional regulator
MLPPKSTNGHPSNPCYERSNSTQEDRVHSVAGLLMHGLQLQPLARTNLYKSIAGSVRRSILNGELKGGTPLRAVDLARAFGVSSTPVREALQELSSDGLVDLERYHWGVVTTIREDDAEEIKRIRMALEPMLLQESIACAVPEGLKNAESIAIGIEKAASWDDWIRGERLFHAQLLDGVKSLRMASIVTRLRDMTIMFISSTGRDTSRLRARAQREHEVMLAALGSRDLDALIASSRDHPALSEILVSERLLSRPDGMRLPANG